MKRNNKLFRNILIIAFIIWLIFMLRQQTNISQYKKDLKTLSSKIELAEEELSQNKQELEKEKENTNSLEYIEKLAREKLGMYLQNERVYVDSNM
ncbi:MAG: hypothetical protein HFJ55_02585 [Clostridia bacterium]|nr:hypothetical protein [Clostridia bacterium]